MKHMVIYLLIFSYDLMAVDNKLTLNDIAKAVEMILVDNKTYQEKVDI